MPAALEVPDFQQGKLSQAEYQQRCASSTSQQLSLLLTSPEYQQWVVQRRRITNASTPQPKSWLWLPALATVFLLALAISPWLAQFSQQQGPGTVADHMAAEWDARQAMWQHDAEALAWNARLPALPADICMAQPWGTPVSTPPVLSSNSQLNTSGEDPSQPGQDAEVVPDLHGYPCSAGHYIPESAHQIDFAAGQHNIVSNSSLAATLLPEAPVLSREDLTWHLEHPLLPVHWTIGTWGWLLTVILAAGSLLQLLPNALMGRRYSPADEELQLIQEEVDELQKALEQRSEELLAVNQNVLALSSRLQCEKGSREATLRDGQRWLDQAQGQLQNTQVALNDKEAECRELATCLEEAAEQAKFFEEEVQRSLAQKQEQEAAVQLLQSKLVSASTRLEGMENVLASQQQESMAAAEAREEAAKKAKALEVALETNAEAHAAAMHAASQKLREAQGQLRDLNEALAMKAREYRSIEGRHRAAQIELKMLQDRQEAVQDMAWRQGMEINNARDETEDITEQYWELHDRMQEKQREMEALQTELEAARSHAAGLQVQSWQAEQTTQRKAREVVTTSRSLSGCLEMAQVQRMGESLSKKLLDSKTACRLADEAAREQLERQRDVEKLPMMQPFRSRSSDKENHSPCSSEHSERIKASPWDSGHLHFGIPSRACRASSSVALDLPSPSTPAVDQDSPLTPGILRYSGASTPIRLSEDRGSEAGSSHADSRAPHTAFKSCRGEHSGSDCEEGVTPKALQAAMSSSLLDTDRDMAVDDRSDSMREFLAEQKRLAAQQQQQKKAMLMELRAVTLSKKAEPEELDPLRAAAHAQDLAVREAQAEAAARKQQHQHQADHARWQASARQAAQRAHDKHSRDLSSFLREARFDCGQPPASQMTEDTFKALKSTALRRLSSENQTGQSPYHQMYAAEVHLIVSRWTYSSTQGGNAAMNKSPFWFGKSGKSS